MSRIGKSIETISWWLPRAVVDEELEGIRGVTAKGFLNEVIEMF